MKLSTLQPYQSRLQEIVPPGYFLLRDLPVLIRDEWPTSKIGATLEVYTGNSATASADGSHDVNLLILSSRYARDFWKIPDQSASLGFPTIGALDRINSIYVDSEVENKGSVTVTVTHPSVSNALNVHDRFVLRQVDNNTRGEASNLPGWYNITAKFVRPAVSIAHWFEGLVSLRGTTVRGQLAAGYLLELPMSKREAWGRYRAAAISSLDSRVQSAVAAGYPEYPADDGDKPASIWLHFKMDLKTGRVEVGRSFGQRKLIGPRMEYSPSLGVKVYNGVELKPNVSHTSGPSWDGMTEVRSYEFVDETQRIWMPLQLDYSVRIGKKATYLCHGDRKLTNLHQIISEVFPGLDFTKAGADDVSTVDFSSLTDGVAQGNTDDWYAGENPNDKIGQTTKDRQSRFFDIIVDAHTAFQKAVRAAIK